MPDLRGRWNELVAKAGRDVLLRGIVDNPQPSGEHHWKITTRRDVRDAGVGRLQTVGLDANARLPADYDARAWRVYVGIGAVNNRPATVLYRRANDPRGWTMPASHPAIFDTRQHPRLVERSLTEKIDRPWLMLETPSQDGTDPGDFYRVPPQQRPRALRARAAWDFALWRASVFVTGMPGVFSSAEGRWGFPVPVGTNSRHRVSLAAKMPTKRVGTAIGGSHELGRIYLLRRPGGDPGTDTLMVQQRCFWSLWTINSEPGYREMEAFGTGLDVFTELATVTAGPLVGLPLSVLLSQAIAGQLGQAADWYEEAATVEFWSA